MDIEILKSKVHRAVITEANLNYVGSLTLDEDLMDAANMIENEKVQIVNVNNGSRIETYLIKGKRGSGTCCLNGPLQGKEQWAISSSSFPMRIWTSEKPGNSSPASYFRKKEISCNLSRL